MRRYILVFLVLLLSGCATSKEPSFLLYRNGNSLLEIIGNRIHVHGKIEKGLAEAFALINPANHYTVWLHSGGGRVDSAEKIAALIERNKFWTRVGENRTCKSACTLIYQAGARRFAHKSAIFMYHSVRYAGINKRVSNVVCDRCTRRMMYQLQRLGVVNDFFKHWPYGLGVLKLEAEQAAMFNIVQVVVP